MGASGWFVGKDCSVVFFSFFGSFGAFSPCDVDISLFFAGSLSLLVALECISLRHACRNIEATGPLVNELVVYKDFSAVVVQFVTVLGIFTGFVLISRNKIPQEAKLFRTDALGDAFGWN